MSVLNVPSQALGDLETRKHYGTYTAAGGTTDTILPMGNLSIITSFTVHATTAGVTVKEGATSESAFPVLAYQTRPKLWTNALYVSGPAGMSISYELGGQ